MALSTLAGSRAAANLPNATPYNPGQQGQSDTSVVGPETNTKKYADAEQAEPLQSAQPDTVLQYPQDDSYAAYILFRAKKINPWDIGADKARKLLETPAITGEKARYKPVIDLAKRAGVNTLGSGGYASGQEGLNEGQTTAESTNYSDQFNTAEFTGTTASRNSEKNASNNQQAKDILGVTSEYVDDLPAIRLYMPQAINISDQVNYNNGSTIGPSGAAATAAINAGGGLGAGLSAFLSDAVGFIGDAFGTAANDPGLRRLALARAAQALPTGQSINNATALGFQVTVNPNTRVLFEGVIIREFQFQFDFYPVSYNEAQVVQKIVKFFRTELYPSTIGRQAGVPIGFNFPHVFEIKFRIGGKNAPLPQPHLCYLRNVQTTYNPGSMSFFDDGSPTHTAMTLAFTEFRTLSKEDINEGR